MVFSKIAAAACAFALMPLGASAACSAPPYHQFDFWVGSWRVTDAAGKLLGYDTISQRVGACALYEDYRDAQQPGEGVGFSAYDRTIGRWRQDFFGDTGFVLELQGSLRGDRMVLEGTDYVAGKPRLNRGQWIPHGGVVEELWTSSLDGGRTWTTRFDGFFHRR